MSDEESENTSTKEFDVEDIVSERKVRKYIQNKKKYITKKEYLVKWVGFTKKTWEPEENLKNCPLILDKYLKRKKYRDADNKDINIMYNQLLKLSECQINNRSYKNFGPSFKDVMNANAFVSKEERERRDFDLILKYAILNSK